MSRPREPQVLLQLPDGAARDALRAGLMALRCVPINLPFEASERYAFLKRMVSCERVFLFIDISNISLPAADRFDFVVSNLPQKLRERTILTRLAGGHVSEADRAWIKTLGFSDLIGEFDARDLEGSLRVVFDLMAMKLELPLLSTGELARYVSAVATTAAQGTPRALIRGQTGLSAEQLVALLNDKLDIQDRSYHLKKYPACFIGSEAVLWMVKRLKLTLEAAVGVGQALGSLGLLHHVEHKHNFSDEGLFFRLAISRVADTKDLGGAFVALQEQLSISDRSYLGTIYPRCWVGSEAVDVICKQYSVARHVGHLILHRQMQFGLLLFIGVQNAFAKFDLAHPAWENLLKRRVVVMRDGQVASIGCPAFRHEADVADRLNGQLEDAMQKVLSDRTRNRIESDTLKVSGIFNWYGQDFKNGWRGANTLGQFLALYSVPLGLNVDTSSKLQLANLASSFWTMTGD